MPEVKIDGARVLSDLGELREIGRYETGVHRPPLSPEHLRSLEWLLARLPEAGLDGAIDGIGNVYGASSSGGRKLLAGSHLESQVRAGWLDGPLGVVYALEAARAINGRHDLDGAAVDVVAWCDEEGHFAGFVGSRSYVGQLSEADIDAAHDPIRDLRLRDALAASGFAGRPRRSADGHGYLGYLEAHIEQGDWLESSNLRIGVVTSINAIWQYRIGFEGIQNHAGTTRMAIRKDAGLAAARLAVAIEEAFPCVAGPRSVWTTGRLTLEPGALSIIPGRAEMMFQFRDTDPAVLRRMEQALQGIVAAANATGPCQVTLESVRKSQPAHMSEAFQGALEAAAALHAPGSSARLPSGAGHDAQFLASRMPAAMMFVPSIGGISHHWTENTSDDDIVLGAQVFASWAAEILAGRS